MVFFFDKEAGSEFLELREDNFTHLIKSRRSKVGDTLFARNLTDYFLYSYRVENISKKTAALSLLSKEERVVEACKKVHIAWSIVDVKTVEKTLPFLNELGVEKLSFFYSTRSQKNIKLNLERCEKILINSSSQCGRSSVIDLKIYNSLEDFLKEFPNSSYLDFGGESEISNFKDPILLGPEGGFSPEDLDLLKNNQKIGLEHSLILRSETAAIAIATKGVL